MAGRKRDTKKGHKKGHKNVPFWVLDGFAKIRASALERMAGTTGLEPAASAVTVTISLVTNRKHAARMALQKRFSKVRKQFVDC